MDLLKHGQRRTFVLCWIAYASIYLCRVNLTIAIPEIQNTFAFSKAQIGLIASMFFWVYGIGQLVNGNLGDKVSSKLIIFLGLVVAAVSNILFGFANSLLAMLIFWTINGYFQSMLWGPITKLLSSWYSEEKLSSIAIKISTSMIAGYLIAWWLSAKLLVFSNWRWVFWTPGILILIFSLIWFFNIKNQPKDIGLEPILNSAKSDAESTSNYSLWQVIKETKLWLVVIACFAQGIIKDGIGIWGPTFLMEAHKLDLKSSVGLILLIPIMNLGGIFIAAWLNKKLKYQEKLTTVILFSIGVLMIMGLIKFETSGPIVGLIFLGLSSAMMYGANTLLLGVIPMKYLKYNKVSSVAGFLDFCSYLSAGIAVAITGGIVDNFSWNGVLILWISVAVLGIISLTLNWKYENIHNAKLAL